MKTSFLESSNKFEFVKLFLTVIICAFILIFSASLSGIFYTIQTHETNYGIKELTNFYGKTNFFLLQLIPFLLTLLSLLLCIKFIYKTSPKSIITSREKLDWKRFGLSFFVWFIILTSFLFFSLALNGNQIKWNFSDSFWYLLVVSIIFVTIQTTFEEVLFRGFLLKELYSASNSKFVSLLFSSILFGLMHFNNPEVAILGNVVLVYFVGTGLFLALLTFLDDGLELSMGFHAANNIFASIILTNNWQVFQTDAIFKDFSTPGIDSQLWLNLLILFPLLIFVYGKIYKWDFALIIAIFTKKSNP